MYFNFQTNEYEDCEIDSLETARKFVRQDVASQGMLECYVGLGLHPLKAMANVLCRSLGKPEPFPIDKGDS